MEAQPSATLRCEAGARRPPRRVGPSISTAGAPPDVSDPGALFAQASAEVQAVAGMVGPHPGHLAGAGGREGAPDVWDELLGELHENRPRQKIPRELFLR